MILKLGSKGEQVKLLQAKLGLTVDGNFGPKTEQAVKDFQKVNNLKVTGQIDTDTLNKLMV